MKQSLVLLACLGVITFWSYEDITAQAKEAVKVAQDKSEQQMYLSSDVPVEVAINSMNMELELVNIIQDKKEWYIAYKSVIEKYKGFIDPPETIYDYYSDDEINLMLRCIETETYQSDFLSKVNVANVILNRLECEEFSTSVYDVITDENQFAYGREIISEDTVLALEYAFEIEDTTQGSIGFHSNSPRATFNGWEYVFTDNAGHSFYKLSE